MAPDSRILVFLDFRTTRRSDQEINKSKRKISLFAKFARSEFGRIFKRATLFRFSTVAINSVFNSLRFAREEAVQFQKALSDIIKLDLQTFGNLGSEATRRLADSIGELSAQFNVTRVAAAKAFQIIVTAGFRGAEALKLFETTLLAQAAAGLSATNATSLLIAIMKQFEIQVGQTEQALNILLITQSKAAVDFGDFSGAFRTGGAALAQITDSLNQSAAAVAALGERTRETGSVVGTFFKTLAARVVGRKQTRQIFQELGIDVEIGGRLRSFIDVGEELAKNIEKLSDTRRGEIISIIAGIRQGNRFTNFLKSIPRLRELEAENAKGANEARLRAEQERQTIEAKLNEARVIFSRNLEKQLLPVLDEAAVAARALATTLGFFSKIAAKIVGFLGGDTFEAQRNLVRESKAGGRLESLGKQFAAFTDAQRQSINKALNDLQGSRTTVAAPLGLSGRGRPSLIDPSTGKFIADVSGAIKNLPEDIKKGFLSNLKLIREELGKADIDQINIQAVEAGLDKLDSIIAKQIKSIESQIKSGKGNEQELRELKKTLTRVNVIRSPRSRQPVSAINVEQEFASRKDVLQAAIDLEQSQIRIVNAYQQILNPSKNFNDSLLRQRNTLVQVARAESRIRRQAIAEIQEQIDFTKKQIKAGKLEGSVTKEINALNKKSEEIRRKEVEANAKILEFDANAVRRLNTRLNELRDGTRDASARLATATKRLLETRKQEASAAESAASAVLRLNDAIIGFQAGLLRSQIEARKITGEIGSFSQELMAVQSIAPQLEGLFSNITGREVELARLRRDSLADQVDIIKSIISEQQRIGESFFGLDQAGRSDLFRGFGAIQNLLGQFGGNIGAFNQLSDQELNQFGRQVLALPVELRRSIINALGFLPQGTSIAGFTADQIRNILSSAALGRSATAGVENIQDLQKRAAEATLELARLNTDGVASSLLQVKIAERSLDEARAQTELAKIRVNLAREQLSVTGQAASAQSANLQQQIATFQQLASQVGAGRGDPRTTAQRVAEAQGLGTPQGVPIKFEDIKGNTLREKIATIQAEQLRLLKEGKLKTTAILDPETVKQLATLKPENLLDTAKTRRDEQSDFFIKGLKARDERLKEALREINEQTKNTGEALGNVISRLEDAIITRALQPGGPDEADQILITGLEERLRTLIDAKRQVDVDIDVDNNVKVNLQEVANVAQVVTDTIKSIPEIRDLKSLKGAVGTVFQALVQAINTGEPVNPSILNTLNTSGTE